MLKIDKMAIQTTTLEVSFSAPWPPIPLVLVASERAQCRLARGPLTPNLQPPRKVAFQRPSATFPYHLAFRISHYVKNLSSVHQHEVKVQSVEAG